MGIWSGLIATLVHGVSTCIRNLSLVELANDLEGAAVRQHTIRNRLIRESRRAGSYSKSTPTYTIHQILMEVAYQRDGKGADVASFLQKDRDFGTAWAHRPPILFQLYPGQNRVSIKPQGVLMDGDRVMLDPYDHPIRDFPELPVTLSSKEKGMWIEYYMRQNKEIKPYDLMGMYFPFNE